MSGTMSFVDLKTQYLALKEQIAQRMQRVLDHGQYIMGPEVHELEERLAAYVGARHCITVASGTEALLISLLAIGLRPGDEVVTSPFTFAATAGFVRAVVCAVIRRLSASGLPSTALATAAWARAFTSGRPGIMRGMCWMAPKAAP